MQNVKGYQRCTRNTPTSAAPTVCRRGRVSRRSAVANRQCGAFGSHGAVSRHVLGVRGSVFDKGLKKGQQYSNQMRPAAVAATEEQPAAATQEVNQSEKQEEKQEVKQVWYALVANAEFYFNDVQNESLAEQLRERVRYFKEQNKEIDFWLVPDPLWLDKKYPQQAAKVRRPCCALVSTDKQWIQFMKLRLDRVLLLEMGMVKKSEVLQMGEKLPQFKKPAKWTAPYSMYAPNWWEVFYPQ